MVKGFKISIWFVIIVQKLNPYMLASFLWDKDKQCILRLDATERGVWSESPLFSSRMLYENLKKSENTTQQPLTRKWTCPIDNGGKFHSA